MRPLPRLLAVAAAALAGSSALSHTLASQLLSRPYDVLHVPHGATTRVAALGHRTFVSDLYWLSTVQYIGEPKADARGWDALFPLVDLVTDLDPRHGYAYQTAGIVLSAAGRLDESDRILVKGIEKGPPYWTFPFYIAFNAWFYRGDYEEGARWAELAARTPGASPNISHLALSLKAKSGSPQSAIQMLRDLLETAKDPVTTSRIEEQMKLAILERDAQALEAAVSRFEREHGRPIATLDQLVQGGYIDALPADPFGGRYTWICWERKVRSSANPFRFSPRAGPRLPEFQYKPGQKTKVIAP
ncbi:MAG: tetratricopeptide repeat protein [Anaeromyxobacteraceae bacterium]